MLRSTLLCLTTAALLGAAACSDDTQSTPDAAPTRDAAVDQDAAAADQAGADMAAPHTIKLFDKVRINSKGTVNVRKAEADFAFDKGPYAKVTLEVELDTSCYPFTKWQANPPPSGHKWPADCDAFDRNFEFLMDPPAQSIDPPALELVRAITPFGGPLKYTVDLTDLANGLPGKHKARVTISTWSDSKGQVTGSNGGWWVTARIKAEPGKAPRKVVTVKALFNHSFKKGTPRQEVTIDVPSAARSAKVEYRVTGHGGGAVDSACIGPAEEFCQRWHKIYLDGKEVKKLAPWRKDCAKLCTETKYNSMTYCKENPCGAISSVKASRANWCPGSVTPPEVWTFKELASAGKHTFGYFIEKVAAKGSWRVSATYFAYGD